MDDLVRQVEQTIHRRVLLARGQSAVVGVSGGVDSMVLLRLVHELAAANRWRFAVAHFNHQLRGEEGDADEALVVQTAQHLGVRCVTDRADVRRHALARRLSLEMAGRELRHDFLARTARRVGAGVILLAHHADDQVESFFLRLLRGAGGRGLAGMRWSSPSPADPRIRLVRPLLEQRKAALTAFAATRGIVYREDTSNRQTDFLRNRLRNEFIPLLTRSYEPTLAKTVPRLMAIVGDEAEFVEQVARHWLARKRRTAFANLHAAVQRQCLRQQLSALGVADNFELIERLRLFAGERVMIEPGITVFRGPTGEVFQAKVPTEAFGGQPAAVDLSAGEGAETFDRLNLRWQIQAQPARGWRAFRHEAGCERFDAEKVGDRVWLRHWRRGDRFQPIGMSAAVKLQDLFTNLKVPRAQRHARVVATTAGGELFWVEGLRMAERFKLDNRTRRCLKWRWRRG